MQAIKFTVNIRGNSMEAFYLPLPEGWTLKVEIWGKTQISIGSIPYDFNETVTRQSAFYRKHAGSILVEEVEEVPFIVEAALKNTTL